MSRLILCARPLDFWDNLGWIFHYPPTKSEGYNFDVVRPSIPSVRASDRLSTLFVCPEPYLSTYLSDLIHFLYK